MLVSLKWLKDYVDIERPSAELAEPLTLTGLEVESCREIRPEFTGVVAARVISVRPHPDADKLSLCEVDIGTGSLPIVCGAPNIAVGQFVPLAKVGATIPGGFKIKSTRIRGQKSEGMLCSEEELGIGSDSTGIMILPDDLSIGADLAEVLDLSDVVFDISITPNRPDCLSIIGIAREVAALTGKKLHYPSTAVMESGEDIHGMTSVEILDPDLCPRYTARMIRNVKIRPSPHWVRRRLEAVGLRAINNVVDVTNFVMMEMGQPLHAFDFRFLEQGRIVVRRSREGESFISLDEKERDLRGDILMICDGVKPVAIGGIMGGLNSEVKDNTDTIFLESAYFDSASIRRSSRWLGMGTDAAFRFERGIDREGVVRALHRAAQLIADLSGGSVCRGYIDEYPQKISVPEKIQLRVARTNRMLGTNMTGDEMAGILESLEMFVSNNDQGTYRVVPPTFRIDVTREIDLIEEIARLYGYDRIPTTMPEIPSAPAMHDRRILFENFVRELLAGRGFSEAIQYSFVSSRAVDVLGLAAEDPRRRLIKIRNPLSEDQAVMRTTMLYSLLETARRNIRTGESDLKIFEIGRLYYEKGKGSLPEEKRALGIIMTGLRYDDDWHGQNLKVDFFDLKGAIETLMAGLRVQPEFVRAVPVPAFLHPGRASLMNINGQAIGFIGEIHKNVLEKMDIKGHVYAAEIDLDLLAGLYMEQVAYQEIPRFPAISRDVAFLVPQKMEGRALISISLENKEELLEKVHIFDVYEGKGIPVGMKSLGMRFSYRSSKRTLTDEEVEKIHERVIRKILSESGAKIRGAEG
jgi:phenylalanyl-tRNA synthetase beta chain